MDGVSNCAALINNFPIFKGSALGDLRGDPPSVAYNDSSSSGYNSRLGPSGGKPLGSLDELASGILCCFLSCRLYRGLVLLKTLPRVLGSDEMVVLGFSSGLVVFPSVVDGFLVFGLLLPGDVLGGTSGGAPGGGGAGCDGLWLSSLSDIEGMTSPSSVLVSDSSEVFLWFLTEIDCLFSSANGFL